MRRLIGRELRVTILMVLYVINQSGLAEYTHLDTSRHMYGCIVRVRFFRCPPPAFSNIKGIECKYAEFTYRIGHSVSFDIKMAGASECKDAVFVKGNQRHRSHG